MKNKIILILPALLFTFVFANAQDLQSKDGKKAKTMSFAESNSLNGSVEPIVNGMPYSQYKAQQAKLKAEQKQVQSPKPPESLVVTDADLKKVSTTATAEVKTTAPAAKVAGGQYADKTIPGVLAPTPKVSAVEELPAASPVENATQPTPVKDPAVSKQGSGN